MFENIIEQNAVLQLQQDIKLGHLAPSMLFFGPPESAKSSAALELARILSCEGDRSWKCSCPACERHRYLQHNDLLVLGCRPSAAKLAAAGAAFLRNTSNPGAKILFIRCIRKVQIRFSSILMEDDPKLEKIVSSLQSLEEEFSQFWAANTALAGPNLEKTVNSLITKAVKIENEGLGDSIPVGRIRQAAYWCRFAPEGKRKTLLIENAEYMRDDGRNSLLKLLEEPPPSVNIILTSLRREAIIPTILSRLRPYRFLKRGREAEKEVIRRIFQDTLKESPDEKNMESSGGLIGAYLDSFLSGGTEKMYPLAAWFIVSAARITFSQMKKKRKTFPNSLNVLAQRLAPIAEKTKLESSVKISAVVKTILNESKNFEDVSFSGFFAICLSMISDGLKESNDPQFIVCGEIFKKNIANAVTAVDVLNQNAALALEALLYNIKSSFLNTRTVRGLYV